MSNREAPRFFSLDTLQPVDRAWELPSLPPLGHQHGHPGPSRESRLERLVPDGTFYLPPLAGAHEDFTVSGDAASGDVGNIRGGQEGSIGSSEDEAGDSIFEPDLLGALDRTGEAPLPQHSPSPRCTTRDTDSKDEVLAVKDEIHWPDETPQRGPLKHIADVVPAVISWDNLRPDYKELGLESQSPFLNDHSDAGVEAVFHTMHHPDHSTRPPIHPPAAVLRSLLLTCTGLSSPLFGWDTAQKRFVWRITLIYGAAKLGKKWNAKVTGEIDEVVEWSGKERIWGMSEEASDSSHGYAISSFAHALSVYITYVRLELSRFAESHTANARVGVYAEPATRIADEQKERGLLRAWAELRPVQEVLEAVADLCGHGSTPSASGSLPFASSALLSHLYSHFNAHVSLCSPILVQSVCAYLFVETAKGWVNRVERWIWFPGAEVDTSAGGAGMELEEGWEGMEIEWIEKGDGKDRRFGVVPGEQDEDDKEERVAYVLRPAHLPSFVAIPQARDLIEMGRGLRLLRRAAKADHPLLAPATSRSHQLRGLSPGWLFVEGEAERLNARLQDVIRATRKQMTRWRRARQLEREGRGMARHSGIIFKDERGDKIRDTDMGENDSSSVHSSEDEDGETIGQEVSSAHPDIGRYEPTLRQMFSAFDAPPGVFTSLLPRTDKDTETEVSEGERSRNDMLHFLARFTDMKQHHLPASLPPSNAASAPEDACDLPGSRLQPSRRTSAVSSASSRRLTILPPSYPTPTHLTNATLLTPLLSWGRLVNSALLSVFFRDLDLFDHLNLLRGFLLMGHEAFRSRLELAIFGGRSILASDVDAMGLDARGRAWGAAVGMDLNNRPRDQWPPGGAELSLALRSTLLDTIADLRAADERRDKPTSRALEELEERLSFGVPDLDELEAGETGAAGRWRDPQAIEALDWLSLYYRPQGIISVLFPPQILEKYQRMFSFLLRLMRVQVVLRELFTDGFSVSSISTSKSRGKGDANDGSKPFETNEEAFKLFHAFRFSAHTLMSAFQGFVVDVGIEVNWRRFLNRLQQLRRDAEARDEVVLSGGTSDGFETASTVELDVRSEVEDAETEDGGMGQTTYELKDIFSLVAYHESVLDRMLKMCFLKKRQEPIMKVIVACFDIVLALGRLIQALRNSTVDEEKAVDRLRRLYERWVKCSSTFIKCLRILEERGAGRVESFLQQRQRRDAEALAAERRAGMDAERHGRTGTGAEKSGGDAGEERRRRTGEREHDEAEMDLAWLERDSALVSHNSITALLIRLDMFSFFDLSDARQI